MKTKRIKCVIKTFSPVHIGCDDLYEPTGFAVDDKTNSLVVFDPVSFISSLNRDDRNRFSEICKKGTIESIIEIYRFLRNRPLRGKSVSFCKGFKKHYDNVLGLTAGKIKQELNKFEIQRTAYSPFDQRPYIPGSAIKGALRTAYLNKLANESTDFAAYIKKLNSDNKYNRRNNKPQIKVHKKLEEKLLEIDMEKPGDKISKDPFRLVKVSDFMPVGDIKTKIFYIINKKKTASQKEAKGPYQILETILPDACFTGEITIEAPQAQNAVSFAIDYKELFESLNLFYIKEKIREDKELGNINITPPDIPSQTSPESAIIRTGRHSGAEAVTIEKYRDIRIKKGQKEFYFSDHSTTLWLASENQKSLNDNAFLPLGWSIINGLTHEAEGVLIKKEEEYQIRLKEALNIEKAHKKEILEKKEREAKQLRAKQQEEEAIKKAGKEKQEKLAAMSPEERAIDDILNNPEIIENKVVEIYNRLDKFSEEKKPELAATLKKYWQNHNKWKKNKCTKKQWEKVQKVKDTLGEI